MMIVDPFRARVLLPATVSYIGATANPFDAADTQSIAGVAIGSTAADRFVFINVNWINAGASASLLSSATIGGVTAKIHANTGSATGHAGVRMGTALISALVPSGTTATVVLTFVTGSSGHQVWLDTYRVTNLLSDTPIDTIATSIDNVQPYSGTIDVQKDGLLLVGAMVQSAAASYTFSGATQDYQSARNGSDQTGIGGSLAVTADELNRAVSISRVGGTGISLNAAVAAASFR